MLNSKSANPAEMFLGFCQEALRAGIPHKLLRVKFAGEIDQMRLLLISYFTGLSPSYERIAYWLQPDGFRNLLSLIATNGGGIGTSSLSVYDAGLSAMELPESERLECDTFMDNLYAIMMEGCSLRGCEGTRALRVRGEF